MIFYPFEPCFGTGLSFSQIYQPTSKDIKQHKWTKREMCLKAFLSFHTEVWNDKKAFKNISFLVVWNDKKAFKNISFLVQFSCVV